MKTRINFLLVVFFAALLLLPACSRKEEKKTKGTGTRVRVMRLEKKNFQRKIRIQGVIQSRQTATVSSLVSGTLDIITADEGKSFKKGEFMFQVDKKNLENNVVLATQDLKVAEANLETAKINRKIAETNWEKAKIDFNRAERLRRSEAISANIYEQAQVTLKNAEAEIEKASAVVSYSNSKVEQERIRLVIVKKNLADSMPPAPFNGVVTKKYVDQGEYMLSGTTIIDLEDINSLEISAIISMLYYREIVPGKTKLYVNYGGKPIEVKISYRSPSVKTESRTFEIKGNLPDNNPQKMICGVLFDGDLVFEEREGYGIPTDALLFRKGGRFVVFTAENGKAVAHEIQPGITDGDLTEIVNFKNLTGKDIITEGQFFINSGDTVSVISEKTE